MNPDCNMQTFPVYQAQQQSSEHSVSGRGDRPFFKGDLVHPIRFATIRTRPVIQAHASRERF